MSSGRRLRDAERDLIVTLLGGKTSCPDLLRDLNTRTVEDLQDGGMGSIRFASLDQVRFGQVVAEADYTDDDGVLVSIVLNTDTSGALYEVDFWKVDFSPVRRYPSPSDLRIK